MVGQLQRDLGALGNGEGLLHALNQRVALVAEVRGIEAACIGGNLASAVYLVYVA